MMSVSFKIKSSIDMTRFGFIMTKYLFPNDVIALTGDLGAGKTTFTKGIGEALGIKRVINSPTFTIMKVYDAENKINGIEKLFHLDVYRLSDSNSDFVLEEYFDMNGIAVIEWADIINDLLPNGYIHITITDLSNNERCFKIEANENFIKKITLEGEKSGYEVIN